MKQNKINNLPTNKYKRLTPVLVSAHCKTDAQGLVLSFKDFSKLSLHS